MNEHLIKLLNNQLKNISQQEKYGKLNFEDIKRLDKLIIGDIFLNKCTKFNGYIRKKSSLFSYNGVKLSLNRLLYHNYIGNVENKCIKLRCSNIGCCTLSHFIVKN